jgi:hypothetical protein
MNKNRDRNEVPNSFVRGMAIPSETEIKTNRFSIRA